MAFNDAALRAIELSSYTAGELVNVLRTTTSRADFDAVALVLGARERRAEAQAQLKVTPADAPSKVQTREDLRPSSSSLPQAEDSARLRRIAEEEAHDILKAAVSKIHEAGKKKEDELSAHLDAVLDKIHALRKWQREDLPATMAMVVEETEAKLKALFSKIHAPLKKPLHDAAPDRDDLALTLGTPSILVAHQSKQPVVEMVSQGDRAAADGSVGIKRKADAAENRGVSPVQISQKTIEDIGIPPGFSPTPRYSSSLCAIKGSSSVEGSNSKTVTQKEPTPLVETGERSEATLITVPVQEVNRLDRGTVSKRGRGRGSAVRKQVSGGSGSGRGRGRGVGSVRGVTTASRNPVLGARPESRQSQSGSLLRPSLELLLLSARNKAVFLPSTAPATGQVKTNIAPGQATAATPRLVIEDIIKPRPSPFRFRINNTSGEQIRSTSGMGTKVIENLGECVLNKADSVPVIDNAAEGTSHEEGQLGSNNTGASRRE